MNIVAVDNLVKRYNEVLALDHSACTSNRAKCSAF